MPRVSHRRKESIRVVWIIIFRFDALGVISRWNGRDVIPLCSQRFAYRICGFRLQLNKGLFEVPELILVELILLQNVIFCNSGFLWLRILSLRGFSIWGFSLGLGRRRIGLGIYLFTRYRRRSLARIVVAMGSLAIVPSALLIVIVPSMLSVLVAPVSIIASIPSIPIPLGIVTSSVL